MNDPAILREAVRALQDLESEHDLAALTEQRVLVSVQRRAQRLRLIRQAAYGAALSLCAVAGAHAAFHGSEHTWQLVHGPWQPLFAAKVVRPKHFYAQPPARREVAAPLAHEARNTGTEPGAGHATVASATSHLPVAELAFGEVERRRRVRSADSLPAKTSERAEAPKPASEIKPTPESLYADAHRLHFTLGDKYAALRAWDDYLAAQPDGTFAPEAHYNRALCLVALDQKDAAIAALRKIAAGEVSAYRAKDARRLLRALDAFR